MSSQPLTSNQHGVPQVPLYNAECVLEMDPEVSRGFVVLLTGNAADPSSSTLSFMSLTDGNVVDACMGAHSQRREGPAYRAAREAKNSLAIASENSEAVKQLAVQTYKKAFVITMEYKRRVKGVLVCFRCFVQGRMRRSAQNNLTENFKLLDEAVATNQ